MTLAVVDLFAGVGGFTLGFLSANTTGTKLFDARLLVDADPTAAFTFKKNFPRVPYWVEDLSRVGPQDILRQIGMKKGELDVLIGGPPCQGFSASGKRWLDDKRNQLLARFVEFANVIQPRCVLLENVPTALSAYGKLFREELSRAFPGYVAHAAVLNASAFGVPQIRRRAFVLALRLPLRLPEPLFPLGEYDSIDIGHDSHRKAKASSRFVSVSEAIGDLPHLKAGQSLDGTSYSFPASTTYQAERRKGSIAIFNHSARAHSREFLKKIGPIRPGKGNSDLPEALRFSDNYFSQAYARLHANGIGFTITAHFRNPGSGRFTHYRDKRSLSVREAARIQSFDDRFVFHGFDVDQERHVGNAVPPLLARALAIHISDLLSKSLAP